MKHIYNINNILFEDQTLCESYNERRGAKSKIIVNENKMSEESIHKFIKVILEDISQQKINAYTKTKLKSWK